MSEGSGKVRVAALGDLHVHENSTDALQGLFEKISQTADVVALLFHKPEEHFDEPYRLREILLKVPFHLAANESCELLRIFD